MKKVNSKALVITIASVLVILSIGALALMYIKSDQTKTYEASDLKIDLPSSFYEKELASVTAYFESQKAIVTVLKEDFKSLELVGLDLSSTLNDYTNAVIENNNITTTAQKIEGTEYKYFTYERSNSGKDYFYVGVVLKSKDAFWLVNFGCEKTNKSEYEQKFINWAKTIKVD